MLIALHKPFGVLSQFTPEEAGQRTLAEFGVPSSVYPIGRLDRDSEGLLLLTDEKELVDLLLNPRRGHVRRYFVQVEGVAEASQLQKLEEGVEIQGRRTLPCRAWALEAEPALGQRDPPIRVRQSIPTSWIALELTEGRNRQVRRMTASAGLPTLRLARVAIGQFELAGLAPGAWKELNAVERGLALAGPRRRA